MFVPNFIILCQVVPEKSLTEKKFTHTHTHTRTQTSSQKIQKLYTPYILRICRGYNNHRLPIATKQSFEIFIELKEIKQRNEVVEKHKCPLKQWKTVEKLAKKSQKSSINRSVIQYILECGSDLFSMQLS